MKPANLHRTGVLTALALLLAGSTTGLLPPCEAVPEEKTEQGPTYNATTEAGGTVRSLGEGLDALSRIFICGTLNPQPGPAQSGGTAVPSGVHLRTNRDLRGSEPSATIDLVTAASTPPGHYLLEYRQAGPNSLVTGTIDLTVEEAHSDLLACLYVVGKGETYPLNQPLQFYACCSLAPEGDPIVQYKWWFDYNGNPSSPPNATTGAGSGCMTTHTYTTAGTRTARLVVRTESGAEAEDTQVIVVQGL